MNEISEGPKGPKDISNYTREGEVPNRQIRATIDGDFAENRKNFLRAARIRGILRFRAAEESSATVPRRAEGSENWSDFEDQVKNAP